MCSCLPLALCYFCGEKDNRLNFQNYFMIGILVQLAISWILLWIFQKENLGVLGFKPTRKRGIDFLVFF
jgi:hypothetical protein